MGDRNCSINALSVTTTTSIISLRGLPCFANTNALREGIQITYQSVKVFINYSISLLTSQSSHSEELCFQ